MYPKKEMNDNIKVALSFSHILTFFMINKSQLSFDFISDHILNTFPK
jgi:hypothetical protein